MAKLVCPTCGREVSYAELAEVPHRPFCSDRCRLIDLGRWLDGEFTLSRRIETDEDVAGLPREGDS